ncbi:MAG TPA: ATPase, T2SS/T4P/T4SS family, partial [Terriglobales bacterium]|nr:ATPase, T2SS/T4P/T4SS family [Terriglobales bacterium]
VVLVGELRDAETVRAALTLAETGHLVLSTLHSPTATQAVRRIVDIFPVSEHAAVRAQLAEVLQGILSQALLPRIGGGRVLACELLVANNAVRALIREDRAHQLPSQIESGQARSGMQSMSQALAALLRAGSIAEEIAAEQAAALGPCRPDGTKS